MQEVYLNMPIIQHQRVLPYSVSRMFHLVNDIASYPQFLPWCKSSEILGADEDSIKAKLILAGGGMQKAFTTLNRLQLNKMIQIQLIEGPFKHLEGFWLFEEINQDECLIKFSLEFEFSNALLSAMFSSVMKQIANTLIDAFSKQAHKLYGAPYLT